MQNLKSFENFSEVEIVTNEAEGAMTPDAMTPMCPISEGAKEMIKGICEGHLCKEGEEYHNDENPEHTYEGYINECMNYLKECMGQPGYATAANPYMG